MINPNEVQHDQVIPVEVPEMVRLDIACGDNKAEGWIGVDIAKTPSVDVQFDLTNSTWPFDDNSVDEARCSHFFEHLDPQQRVTFMNELHRILKPGAGCTFITPRGFERQVQDFTHKWPPVVTGSYFYFSKQWLEDNKLTHYRELHGIKCDFEIRPINISVTPEFALKSEEHKLFAAHQYANVAVDLVVVVVKR